MKTYDRQIKLCEALRLSFILYWKLFEALGLRYEEELVPSGGRLELLQLLRNFTEEQARNIVIISIVSSKSHLVLHANKLDFKLNTACCDVASISFLIAIIIFTFNSNNLLSPKGKFIVAVVVVI